MTMLKPIAVEVAQLSAGCSIADTSVYAVWNMYGILKAAEDEVVHEVDGYGDKEYEVNVIYTTKKTRPQMFDFTKVRRRYIK